MGLVFFGPMGREAGDGPLRSVSVEPYSRDSCTGFIVSGSGPRSEASVSSPLNWSFTFIGLEGKVVHVAVAGCWDSAGEGSLVGIPIAHTTAWVDSSGTAGKGFVARPAASFVCMRRSVWSPPLAVRFPTSASSNSTLA
jgi:hypothetical protein